VKHFSDNTPEMVRLSSELQSENASAYIGGNMSSLNVTKSGCLLASLLLLPAFGFAAPHKCGPPEPAMAAGTCPCAETSQTSKNWNFQKEGSQLLKDINRDAREVRQEAATVKSQYPSLANEWFFQADELNMMRYEINQMGQRLCRLQTIHDQLAPWQQKAVEATAPRLKELAIFTEDAIHFANDHRSNMWNPTYRTYMEDIYSQARQVSTATRHEG
jgi:hypothetical protein